jgi:hypothetical protein
VTHLTALRREGLISEWHDRKLRGGADWAGEIDDELNRALVILLLISPDFIASDHCIDKELKRAMERHEAGEARVIPVIVRDFDREISPEVFPFMKLQFLPSEGKPIKQWDNENAAFVNCTFQGQKHGCKDFRLRFQLPSSLKLRRDKSDFALRATTGQDDPTGWGSLSSYHHQIIKKEKIKQKNPSTLPHC